MSPVLAAIPVRTAAPLPWLRSWVSTVRPGMSPEAARSARISPVRSREPSSTTMISVRSSSAATRRMISSTVASSP